MHCMSGGIILFSKSGIYLICFFFYCTDNSNFVFVFEIKCSTYNENTSWFCMCVYTVYVLRIFKASEYVHILFHIVVTYLCMVSGLSLHMQAKTMPSIWLSLIKLNRFLLQDFTEVIEHAIHFYHYKKAFSLCGVSVGDTFSGI